MSFFLYGHGGSGNHGCEAIVRSTQKILENHCTVYSIRKEEDDKYIQNDFLEFVKLQKIKKRSLVGVLLKICKIFNGKKVYYQYKYSKLLRIKNSIIMSIGGDNYCGYGNEQLLIFLNKSLSRNNKTVLWGCSIEPRVLEDSEFVSDMHRYSLIIARESITYDALLKAKVTKNSHLFPDPAFQLEKIELPLPQGFFLNNTIGINISPLIMKCEEKNGATMENYIALIEHIIKTTDMQIALIPHVVWYLNDDRVPLGVLYEKFKHTNRVLQINDHNCMELKGYIARCRMFIGARTHATIAAYSSCIPTLVIGYSVKAKGIAKDIFGTFENYVLPVQNLRNGDDIIKSFEWLKRNEKKIKRQLQLVMPEYCKNAKLSEYELSKLLSK